MGEVIGHLRHDKATFGEKQVLRLLSASLPPNFQIYVECPLPTRYGHRFPDFIVLCNFGVIVLEVKDWVQIVEADRYYARIRRRSGEVARERNPVIIAKGFAELLATELQTIPQLLKRSHKLNVPWGYAAILPRLPLSIITQLRRAWGDANTLGLDDLKHHVVTKRLKATLPYDRALRRQELDCIRGVINPSILIAPEDEDKPAIILDQDQEKIVTEAPRAPVAEQRPEPAPAVQERLFEEEGAAAAARVEEGVAMPPIDEAIVFNAAIRLVRGVAGSGKTLVLTRRARYLAAQYPEWRMGVFTFNDALARSLRAQLTGIRSIRRVTTFHRLCSSLLRGYMAWKTPCNPEGWVENHRKRWPLAQERGAGFVSEEITWMKEMGINDRETYLACERRGRGRALGRVQRNQIYDIGEVYQNWLTEQSAFDWADVAHLVLQGMDEAKIKTGAYDAILIDEAQDFAPVWIEVIKRLLKPESGLLFMADDPSQSIYRFYSWRQKGVPVVGRTRWLRIPYRNTREIYQAAYEVIREDEVLRRHLEEQLGMMIAEPDVSSPYLRSGERPELRRFDSVKAEMTFVRLEIERLLQEGYHADEIVVLHRRTSGVKRLGRQLRGLGVKVATFHALKGLEYEAVFLSQMQEVLNGKRDMTEQQLSEERRLVYMAMTRARERLYLSFEGRWPKRLTGVLKYVERVLV